MNRFDYCGEFAFPVEAEELWRTIEQFDRFESWWPWLRSFSADSREADADGMAAGCVLHGIVVPPVPVRLRLDVTVTRCVRLELIEATVAGDLHGSAVLRFAKVEGGGTQVTAAWSLEMATTALRLAAEVAYPVMRWGHDRVVDMAVASFRRRALSVGVAS